MKKVMLIIPPTGIYLREDRCQSKVEEHGVSAIRPPLVIMQAASILEEGGAECIIKDYPAEKRDWESFKNDFQEFYPDILIVNITGPTIYKDVKAYNIAKELNKDILTVSKGGYAFLHDKKMLERFQNLDVVYRGEVDFSLLSLLERKLEDMPNITYRKAGEVVRNETAAFYDDLDNLPFPARHLVKNELYLQPDTKEKMTVIQTQRGCPALCRFCLTKEVSGRKIRTRSVYNVIEEVKECANKYGIKEFFFNADTLTWNKQWVIDLCQKIIENELDIRWYCNSRVNTFDKERAEIMKKAGCFMIGFGVEAGNQKMLNFMKKGITMEQTREAIKVCKEVGVGSYAFAIVGNPWETKKDIQETVSFVLNLDPDFVDFVKFRLMPGTEFYNMAKEEGLIKQESEFSEPEMKYKHLTNDQVNYLRKNAIFKFYTRPTYIAKKLKDAKSPKIMFNYIKYGTIKLFGLMKK